MKTVWTIARRELRSLFDHPTGYILLVVFVVVTDFLFFRQAYLTNVASLRPMLQLLPWIFLFFVPAVTMRSLSEDLRSGTLEVVLAQPVSELELLAGKYLGQLLFVWIALFLTLPVAIGLSLGADLQTGVMVAQYAGAFLLAAGLTGVGLWASSITPNQITAFIAGVSVMFALILVGVDPIVAGLPVVVSNAVASLSVLRHFENIARGVIDLRDALYFVSLAAVFLALAYGALMARKLSKVGATRRRLRIGLTLIVALLVVINLFGRNIGGRLDLTPGKAYTLSPATRSILGNLDDLVTIKLFVSEELPTEFAIVRRDVNDLLADLRSAGEGKVRVIEVDPQDDPDAERDAQSLGIPPVQFNVIGESELQVKEGYLGIAVQYADGTETIPIVQRTEDLEYQLVSFIRALTRTERQVVGVVDAAAAAAPPGQGSSYAALRQELQRNYDVRAVALDDSAPIADDIDVLVLAGAPFFLDSVQLDRFRGFVDRGGDLLVMAAGMGVDPQQGFMASARPVGWNRLLEPWGVTVRPDIVYDLASNERVSMPVQGGRLFMAYPFWPRALSTRQSVINQDIESAVLPWTSTIDTTGAPAGSVTPLLVTSEAAGTEAGRAFLAPQRDFPRDSLRERLLAVQATPAAADSTRADLGRAVVVGNADFVADRNAQVAPEGLIFVLNAVDWLAQDDALIGIRAKDRRPPALVYESGTTQDAVKWANVAGVPLLLILGAAVRLWRRRQRARDTYATTRAGGAT
jgi:ABC-type uncharacterized transport system involved in gliding motility auxiliary subunit/ABC-type transport system involved in multi-copper enzyme maturation permease subunit